MKQDTNANISKWLDDAFAFSSITSGGQDDIVAICKAIGGALLVNKTEPLDMVVACMLFTSAMAKLGGIRRETFIDMARDVFDVSCPGTTSSS